MPKKPMAKKNRAKSKKRAKPSGKKVFRVFEAGSGINPVGLFKKAVSPRGKKREFIGVEQLAVGSSTGSHWFDLIGTLETLREAGLRKMPSNMKFLDGRDAVREISRLPSESQNVIVASYFLNNLTPSEGGKFLANAKRVLKPGGRMLAVCDKMNIGVFKSIAERFGMGLHYREIPDKAAALSDSESIRERATIKQRIQRFERLINKPVSTSRPGANIEQAFQDMRKQGLVQTREDMLKPTLVFLRKPRQTKKR